MGEIAEMMLDGTLCEGCGVFMEDLAPENEGDQILDPPGSPRRCDDCEPASDCSAGEVLSLLRKIEAAAHGHCDGARERGKSTEGIRQISSWAAKAQKLLQQSDGDQEHE